MKNLLIGIGVFIAVVLLGVLLCRPIFYTFVDNYEFAYRFDALTGNVEALKNKDGSPRHGYVFAIPLIENIHTIDMRPMQVCISSNSRVLNCKLVNFDSKGYELFIKWHGRDDYSKEKLESILMSYAYDPSQSSYPFLKIQKELKNQDTDTISSPSKVDSIR
jgi:hypothetical protein